MVYIREKTFTLIYFSRRLLQLNSSIYMIFQLKKVYGNSMHKNILHVKISE